jgi:putative peptide zinc metalloprotease protein
MNLSEALDAALPEIPKARYRRTRPPLLDPSLIIREDMSDGEPVIGVLDRATSSFYRLPPSQWKLAQLFDGSRSFTEIAELHTQQVGELIDEDYVRMFAEAFQDAGLWYKTPQEKNLALNEKLSAQRSRRAERKSKFNLAHVAFSAWDPDRYLTWLDRSIGAFIYSRWCVLSAVLLFVFESVVFIAKWSVIGPDISLYYNFTKKTLYDIAEFWVLLFILGFIHESAHGLTCKHFGGEVHSMGLMFLYMTPCFFVDVTEAWIYANRPQRLATIIAGIWVEMVACGIAMIVWTNTAPGEWVHDFSYKIILITGVAVVVMNLNPLLKLDGYYFFTETIRIPDLKETSTAFVSGWFQNHILRLPVEVPPIPRRRILLFTVYALASGAYSYFVIFAVVRFVYNVTSNWLAEFALIPTLVLAYFMFKSRLPALRKTIVNTWSEGLASGLRSRPKVAILGAALVALLFVPLWRDRENAYYEVEPENPATVHASMPGRVETVFVKEGQTVRAGQPLLRMTSSDASSMRSSAQADTSAASFKAFDAQVRGASLGTASTSQEAALRSTNMARTADASLTITAPSDGTVLTADPASLLNQDVGSGQALLAMADGGPKVARIFVPFSAIERIPEQAEVALTVPGSFSVLRLRLNKIDSEAIALPSGIVAKQEYKGVELPTFYSSRIALPASATDMRLGTAGTARIFGVRRSIFGRIATALTNVFRAHVW